MSRATFLIDAGYQLVYLKDPDADRALPRDVFRLPHVDVGGG